MFLFLWPEFLHRIFPALENVGESKQGIVSERHTAQAEIHL